MNARSRSLTRILPPFLYQVKNQQQQQTSKPLHAITEANTYVRKKEAHAPTGLRMPLSFSVRSISFRLQKSTHKPVEERSPHSFSSREQAPDHVRITCLYALACVGAQEMPNCHPHREKGRIMNIEVRPYKATNNCQLVTRKKALMIDLQLLGRW